MLCYSGIDVIIPTVNLNLYAGLGRENLLAHQTKDDLFSLLSFVVGGILFCSSQIPRNVFKVKHEGRDKHLQGQIL